MGEAGKAWGLEENFLQSKCSMKGKERGCKLSQDRVTTQSISRGWGFRSPGPAPSTAASDRGAAGLPRPRHGAPGVGWGAHY